MRYIIFDRSSSLHSYLTDQHLIDEHPEPPPVHGSGVWRVGQHLRGQKLRGPTECAGPVPKTHASVREMSWDIESGEDRELLSAEMMSQNKSSTLRNSISLNVWNISSSSICRGPIWWINDEHSPSLQSPKSAIFTKPSVSSSRLSNLRSLTQKRKRIYAKYWLLLKEIEFISLL